ncbi:MAG TPA: ComEC/Rec2 family competence protein [Leptolyngbyaceae cyanobacterium M65_K2018_010]|nr:ComEC/Rec2 family competence protein [Leptolyngbyaceae cyanobacterium M65_K2018_010]
MDARAGWWGCAAYGAGLLVVSLWVRSGGLGLGAGVAIAAAISVIVATLAAIGLPPVWKTGPTPSLWLSLGAIALVAILNYGWQYPTPSPLDISHRLAQGEAAGAQQEVWGQVTEMPRLTRRGKGQFWLKVNQFRRFSPDKTPLGPPEITQGKLYVTVPAAAIEDLYPGQRVKVSGKLYSPALPKNPNAFNFKQYLANHDCYAGFSGQRVALEKGRSPGWWRPWRLRVRIARAHAAGLGDRIGPLVSAMALGRRAVNIPYDLQDTFMQAGLAHTLAASGFHVSLVLGVVLGMMNHPQLSSRWKHPGRAKLIAGGMALASYVLLTGGQPSVMRAALMGAGVLIGLALDRRVQPVGCLVLAVTLLLIWNPTWIDDIGFRLSVMATFGLIVGVQSLTQRLEWLPPTIATLVAVPLAAYLWTIPLSLYYFNTLTTYSILLNMVVTPLVTVISLGGIASGLVALLSPDLGGLLAALLQLPTQGLIWLVEWETKLPGSALATGHISLLQMFGLYGLYGLGGWHPGWRSRRWLVGLLLVLVACGPLWYRVATQAEVTVLAADKDAVMVVQDRHSTLLVNSGTEQTAVYTVLPYLRQAGVNRLAQAIWGADSDLENWQQISAKAPIRHFYSPKPEGEEMPQSRTHNRLSPGKLVNLGRQTMVPITGEVQRFTFFGKQTWLLLAEQSEVEQRWLVKAYRDRLRSEVLWWDGGPLSKELIHAVQPQVAIASSRHLDPQVEAQLIAQGIQVYCTGRHGAITWNPRQGYRAYLATAHADRFTWE